MCLKLSFRLLVGSRLAAEVPAWAPSAASLSSGVPEVGMDLAIARKSWTSL